MTQDSIGLSAWQFAEQKVPVEIVYRTPYNKTAVENGIIRDVFSFQDNELLILESGLPILMQSIVHMQAMPVMG